MYSLKELDHAIDLTTHQDATEEEKNILKGIVKFGNITVKQIMKTRLDVSGIDFNTSFGELIKRVEDFIIHACRYTSKTWMKWWE